LRNLSPLLLVRSARRRGGNPPSRRLAGDGVALWRTAVDGGIRLTLGQDANFTEVTRLARAEWACSHSGGCDSSLITMPWRQKMTTRSDWFSVATLAVSLVTLAAVTALLLRPGVTDDSNAENRPTVVERDFQALRDDIEELRAAIEASRASGAPVDLSSVESRLDALEQSMMTVTSAVEALSATARTICQMVADSPFTPEGQC